MIKQIVDWLEDHPPPDWYYKFWLFLGIAIIAGKFLQATCG